MQIEIESAVELRLSKVIGADHLSENQFSDNQECFNFNIKEKYVQYFLLYYGKKYIMEIKQ